jgi:hypothetical protein
MTSIRSIAGRAAFCGVLLASVAGAQGPGGLQPAADEPPTRQGTRGANFLHLGITARANAMAGAVGTSVSGPSAWYWNPAGAALTESFEMAAGRQNLYGDLGLSQNYLAFSIPLIGGAVGVSVNSLNSGDIPLTDENAPFGTVQRGQFFEWSSIAVTAGYAARLTDRLDVGMQGKYISEGVIGSRITFLAADIGTQFRTGLYGLILSGTLQNIGTGARHRGSLLERGVNTNDVARAATRFVLYTREVELPTAFQFAIGNDLYGSAESLLGRGNGDHKVYTELSINDAVDLAVQTSIGAEYAWKNTLFLRGGKRFYNDNRGAPGDDGFGFGMAGGFGVRLPVAGKALRFDYSYTALGDLRDIQVFSLEIGR